MLDNAIMELVRAAGMDLPYGSPRAIEYDLDLNTYREKKYRAVVGREFFRRSMADRYDLSGVVEMGLPWGSSARGTPRGAAT